MKDSDHSEGQDEAGPSEIDQLVELLKGMGADEKQSAIMARQLSKRATQLSAERNITRVAAMEHLLKITVSGRQGEVA